MSTIEKIVTKSNSHRIKTKTKQFNLFSLDKIRDLTTMRLVYKSTKKQINAKFKKTFPFLKIFNFTVINVIRYQLKSLKCSFIST